MRNEEAMCEGLLSVVIPVYNIRDYVERCVRSVLAQPDVPLEQQDRFRVMDTKAFYEQEVSFSDRFCIVGHGPVVLYQHEGQNASPILHFFI